MCFGFQAQGFANGMSAFLGDAARPNENTLARSAAFFAFLYVSEAIGRSHRSSWDLPKQEGFLHISPETSDS